MAKAKISSKDFLDLLDEQSDQPAPALGSFRKAYSPLAAPLSAPQAEPLKPEQIKRGLKTAHKPDTNRAQTGHKVNTKPDTNRAQTGHSASPSFREIKETGHKPDTQPDTRLDTNRTQTAHKPDTKTGFSSLVGLQREIAIFVYRACQYARGQETDPLTLEHVSASLKIRIGSVKTTFRRLEEKGILERIDFRNGRGGWSKYRLPEIVFREMLQLETGHKLNTNRAQTGHKVDTQPDTQPDTSLSSSSSYIDPENLKTTTTSEPELFDDAKVQLSPDWSAIDFAPLSEIGFTQTHLIQLAKHAKLSAAEIQDSIHFFAFDLKRNGKGRELKGPPLNFFMGILRKGLPYAPPENYESPEAEARQKYLEGKRRLEERRLAEEQELKALAFAEWRRSLTELQVRGMVPEAVKDVPRAREASLSVYFDEQVYPGLELARSGDDAALRAQVRATVAESFGEANK